MGRRCSGYEYLFCVCGLTLLLAASELVPGAATIDIAAGTYEEGIHLDKAADDGLTINGAGGGAGGTKSCKKPSNANKHGKRCTILTALGSFSHIRQCGRQQRALQRSPERQEAAGWKLRAAAGATQRCRQRSRREEGLYDRGLINHKRVNSTICRTLNS
jgi:hypothetical protein